MYEGAESRIANIQYTVRINDVDDRVTIRHAIVAEAIHLNGPPGHAQVVDPSEIGGCDILELDCEGAETEIIPELSSYPKTLIVETHRNESAVRDQLTAAGYEVTNRGVEKKGEIYVLTAVLDSRPG